MKVRELIEALRTKDQDAVVIFWDEFGWMIATDATDMFVQPEDCPPYYHRGDVIEVRQDEGGVPAVAIESSYEKVKNAKL